MRITEEEGTFSNSIDEASITLIQKPDKNISRKENYRPIFLTNAKIPINVIYPINRISDKNHMIDSINAESI